MTLADFEPDSVPKPERPSLWKWYVCVLLLLATVVNYMDRLTVNTLAIEIQTEFHLNDEQYGQMELGFGLAYAAGSLLFGWLVDRVGVYWLYPLVLAGWSAMGFLTGLSQSSTELFLLRIFLGLFEAGHFPCGLKTIQLMLVPRDRALGNSILQSGSALGSILAPQAIRMLMTSGHDNWRLPFLVIGAGGSLWVFFWLASIRRGEFRVKAPRDNALEPQKEAKEDGAGSSLFRTIWSAPFLSLVVVVICINLNWHIFRVWLPKFLREARGYDRTAMLNFTTFYYVAADVGSLTTGFLSSLLARRGLSVFASRMWVYAGCCLLTLLTTAAALLPAGPWLLAALLGVAFGGLGVYTAYYSLVQDLSHKHMGKITGILATTTWLVSASFHPLFGRYLDQTKRYDLVIGASGWLPLVGLIAVLVLWNRSAGRRTPTVNDILD